MEFEVVSISRGSRRVSNTRTRPIIAIDAEVPQRTVVQIDIPATDEVPGRLPDKNQSLGIEVNSVSQNHNLNSLLASIVLLKTFWRITSRS